MDSALIEFLVNVGTAGVVIILMISGYLVPKPAYLQILRESTRKDQVIAKQQEVIDLERQRSNDVAQAGAVTNSLIGAVYSLAAERRSEPGPALADTGHPTGLDPSGKDPKCGGLT